MTKSASSLAADLRRVLQAELELAQQMLKIANAQTQALVANNAVALLGVECDQRGLLARQSQLEANRAAVVGALAQSFTLAAAPTLNALLPHLDTREQATLNGLRVRLLAVHARLARAGATNRQLIENALAYVEFSFDALTDAALKPARYGTNLAALAAPTFYLDSKA